MLEAIKKKYLNRIVTWLFEKPAYRWFVLDFLPRMRLSNKYTELDGEDFRVAYDRLKAGDIILTTDRSNVTTKLVGGMFTHGALCIGKDATGKENEVVEMLGDGFTETDFYTLCKQSDRIAILRCDAWDPEYIEKVIAKALTFRGTPYDIKFQFESGFKSFYCTELIYESDFERRAYVSLEDFAGLGREYISPTGYYNGANISKIFISKEKK